ncbi:MAG: ABC transporter permease [Pseudomonadota bacterium]
MATTAPLNNDAAGETALSGPRDYQALTGKTLWFLLPPILVLLLLFLAAYLTFIVQSFHELRPGLAMVGEEWTLNSYRRFLGDALYPSFLWESIWRSAEMTLITLVIAYPLAYFTVRTRSSAARYIIMIVMLIPLLAGGITIAYAWIIMLGNVGLINSALKATGLIEQPIKFLYSWRGVIISVVHYLTPFAALVLLGPIQNIPRSLEEAAINLGATKIKVFVKVIFPLTISGLIETASLTFALALSSFLFPLLLGGGRVKMMSNIIYEKIAVSYDLPFAAVLAVMLLLTSLAAVLGLARLQNFFSQKYEL